VFDRAKGLFEVGGTVSADCQQALCQTDIPFSAYSLKPLSNRICNRRRHAFAGEICQSLDQGVDLGAFDIQAHLRIISTILRNLSTIAPASLQHCTELAQAAAVVSQSRLIDVVTRGDFR
jgi:hypothetical protein